MIRFRPRLRVRRDAAVLLVILALALVVRLWGIDFGLPFVYHVDEARFADLTIRYFQTHDFNPRDWRVPPTMTYVIAAAWEVWFLGGKLTGAFPDTAAFVHAYRTDPTTFILLGRLITVALSLGTIALLFAIGRRIGGTRAGALAALFLVLSPEHNRLSRYLNPDVPMLFFLVLSFYFVWNIFERGRTRDYLLAGAAAGLAFSAKFGGVMMALPLFLAHVFRTLDAKRPKWRLLFDPPLVAAGAAFAAAFVVTCPLAVAGATKDFIKGFRWQSRHLYEGGHYGSTESEMPLLFYLRYGLRENVGPWLQALVPVGLVAGLAKLRKGYIVLAAFPIVHFVTAATWRTYATRYLLSAAPFLILIAALALDAGIRWVRDKAIPASKARGAAKIVRAAAAPVLALAFAVPSGITAYRFGWSLAHKDTRTQAMDWINENLPPKTIIALEAYCPQLPFGRYRIVSRQPSLSAVDLEWLSWKRVDYVVVSELEYGRFVPYPKEFAREARFYRTLDERALLVKSFPPRFREDLLTMHNPEIRIYRMSDAPDPAFPGNFGRLSQSASLLATGGGDWILTASAAAEDLRPTREVVKNPYARVVAPDGSELARVTLKDGAVTGAFSTAGESRPFRATPGCRVLLGYEYDLRPAPPGEPDPARMRKEAEAGPPLTEEDLRRTRYDVLYLYATFPGARGDAYRQSVVMRTAGAGWSVATAVSGGELRWGGDTVTDPFAIVTDAKGRDILRVPLAEGKDGAPAAVKAPLRSSAPLPVLPATFKVYAGYARYFNKKAPEASGGPGRIEYLIPPAFAASRRD